MNYPFNRLRFSEEEATDLMYAWVAISFAFAVVLSGGLKGGYVGWNIIFLQNLIIAGVAVGSGFLLHELAHKIVAQKYGCWAEFRKFDLGLILAVAMSFFGFIFAAPGAVMIGGFISREQNGKISAVGPATNLMLAGLFLGLLIVLSQTGILPVFLMKLFSYGFYINAWLALFNMLPITPLDGVKVMSWSLPVWIAITLIAGLMVFVLPIFFVLPSF